jgi:membrane-bound metal-dependent hydrolase YbcI (DUF457 family)
MLGDMAGYRGHISGAIVFCAIYVVILTAVFSIDLISYRGAMLHGGQHIAALFVLAFLFGLWPDIDTNSKGQDLFFGAVFILDILLVVNRYFEAAAYLGLLAMLPILGKHRGWTHSKLAMFLVPLPIGLVPYMADNASWQPALIYYGAAVVGYFSHLFFDGLIFRFVRPRR